MYAGGEHRVCGRRRGAAGHLAGATEDALVAVRSEQASEPVLAADRGDALGADDPGGRALAPVLAARVRRGGPVGDALRARKRWVRQLGLRVCTAACEAHRRGGLLRWKLIDRRQRRAAGGDRLESRRVFGDRLESRRCFGAVGGRRRVKLGPQNGVRARRVGGGHGLGLVRVDLVRGGVLFRGRVLLEGALVEGGLRARLGLGDALHDVILVARLEGEWGACWKESGRRVEAGSNGRRRRRGTGRLESEVRCSRARHRLADGSEEGRQGGWGRASLATPAAQSFFSALVGALFFSFLASCCA